VSEGSAHGGRAAAHAAGRDIPAPAEPAIDVARLRVAIARLSRRLRRHELAGLTPTQLSALATVERAGPVRLGDLAAAEGIAPSTLTRLVTALEERAYVTRCPVPGDARASTLSITESGHAVLHQIRQESTNVLAESLRTLPAGQLVALAAALPALEQLADADAGMSGTGSGPGAGGAAGTAAGGQAPARPQVPRAAGV
jgi:DNA-binding MarR family transcriptional regulator